MGPRQAAVLSPSLRVPVGNIGTRIFTMAGTRQINAATNRTYANIIALDQHFDAVRLIYKNTVNQPTNNFNLGDVSIAVGADKTDGTGDALSWTAVTFGGVKPVAATPVVVTTSTGQTDADPDFYFSDWMPKSSIPRTDGGTLPLLYVRTYYPTVDANSIFDVSTFGAAGKGADSWGYATAPGDRIWLNKWVTGNKAAITGTSVPALGSSAAQIHSALAGVQYLARGRVINVMAIGDSINAGMNPDGATGVTVQGAGATQRACAAVSDINSIAVQYSAGGLSGQTQVQYYTRLARVISIFNPDVVVYSGGTPNGGGATTQALADSESYYTARAIDLCKTKNAIPVVMNEIPDNSADGVSTYTAGQDAFRQAYNTKLLSMYVNGILVADVDATISAGGSPAPALTGYMSSDWVHPNDTGYAAMSVPVSSAISKIVTANR